MKTTHTILSFGCAVLLGTALIVGCGDDDTTTSSTSSSGGTSGTSGTSGTGTSGTSGTGTSGTSGTGTSSSGDAQPPGDAGTKPPALGAQIDRFGRPAINTALNKTFLATAAEHDTAQDNYNKDSDRTKWVANYKAEFATNLALYDGVDTQCGNQAAADNTKAANADRYGALAGLVADDRQFLNVKGTTATRYLAVELNFIGVTNTDQGGRKLAYDVIDTTYSVVGGNPLQTPDPLLVTDGIGKVDAKTDGATFPYLAAAP